MENIKFHKLTISEWKQFSKIEIDFHPNLTILTGANGSGKTTILNILAKHFGWALSELATPAAEEETGIFKYFARWFKKEMLVDNNKIGEICYSNEIVSNISVPDKNQAQYTLSINKQQPVRGLNIPSHRPIFYYQQVPNISTSRRTKEQAFQLVHQSNISRFQNAHTQPANYYIKETLLNWAISGSGNEFIQSDKVTRGYYIGFQEVLKTILPKTLGFNKLSIRNYEIILETETGDFMLDAVSGGVSAIIDIGWQLFNFSKQASDVITVLIDEVENHLHATMQRAILPSLILAFPNIQFVVSTHSPLIVGSVQDSNVYVFRYNKDKRIVNEKLDLINKAKTASEILDEVLGVPFTMPIWVEDKLNQVIKKYSYGDLNTDAFKKMREEMKSIGLEHLMPLVIDKTIGIKNDKN